MLLLMMFGMTSLFWCFEFDIVVCFGVTVLGVEQIFFCGWLLNGCYCFCLLASAAFGDASKSQKQSVDGATDDGFGPWWCCCHGCVLGCGHIVGQVLAIQCNRCRFVTVF